jgi:hypothetical protein
VAGSGGPDRRNHEGQTMSDDWPMHLFRPGRQCTRGWLMIAVGFLGFIAARALWDHDLVAFVLSFSFAILFHEKATRT